MIEEGQNTKEDVSFRHTTEPLPVGTILAPLSDVLGVDVAAFQQRRRNSALRAVAARMLIRFAGLTQRQAAVHLMMGTGGAVSAQVRRLPDLLAEDRRLKRAVKRVEDRLVAIKQGQPSQSR